MEAAPEAMNIQTNHPHESRHSRWMENGCGKICIWLGSSGIPINFIKLVLT
jgi:hypothetical protein